MAQQVKYISVISSVRDDVGKHGCSGFLSLVQGGTSDCAARVVTLYSHDSEQMTAF